MTTEETMNSEARETEQPGETNQESKGQEVERARLRAAPIQALDTGVIVGSTFEEQYRLARLYCQSRMLPQAFDTPEKVFTAMQFCYELGLKGITALRNVCVINGTPSLWGDLPLALVKKSDQLESIEEWVEDKNGAKICPENKNLSADPAVAICRTKRRNGTQVTTWFTAEESRRAELLGNPKKEIWSKYLRRMLQMRARAQNLKDNFGDVLMGAPIAEYDHNAVVEGGEVVESHGARQTKSVASELNERFLDGAREEG